MGKGHQIGVAILRALAFVDDIATLCRNHMDAYQSHQCVVWFSSRKRLLLNALKCLLLCINAKKGDVIPRLKIGETALSVVTSAKYLGDIFNCAGNNNDMIEDRKKKGKACIINALSVCSEVTMGIYTIQTMMLLYRSVFLAVMLYNAQSWSKLSTDNINTLQVVQLSYLKRMLHAPTSTSNAITFLETGVLPIEFEVHIKQLTFLHHILTLHEDDPVKLTYTEQGKYQFEANWANEVGKLRKRYEISEKDEDISRMKRDKWKAKVKECVGAYAWKQLKDKAAQQKLGQKLSFAANIEAQKYLFELPSPNARKVFHIRSGTIDLRAHRCYTYGNNITCRLCGENEENVEHVVNVCPDVPRAGCVDVLGGDVNELLEVSKRCMYFEKRVDETSGTELA